MNAVELGQYITQQVAVNHAVDHAAKHGGDGVTAVMRLGALQLAEVLEQAGAMCAVRPHGNFLVDEGDQGIAGQSFFGCTPITPTIRRFDGWLEFLTSKLCLGFAHLFMVVQELEEHHPCEHGQAVAIAVQALVLAHNVPRGLDDGVELLGGGLGLGAFLGGHRRSYFLVNDS